MIHTISVSKKCLSLFIIFTSLVIVGFNAYYLLRGYDQLLADYLSLNDCLYRADDFSFSFFNKKTHRQGIYFSTLSLLICISIFFLFVRKYKKKLTERDFIFQFHWKKETSIYLLLISLFSISAWVYGFIITPPSYDEVFSAHKATSLPLFQTLSYYMLPNNHVFFNVINRALFFWAEDKVLTGKIISLVAYISWNFVAFIAIRKLTGSALLALIASLTLGLQLYNWGFSFQARGYEIYGCCEFISLLCLWAYSKRQQSKWLFLNTFVSIIGYACLPTFMYVQAAQILFGCWLIFKSEKIDFIYVKYQGYIFIGVFMFYLPALCYSGLTAFTENPNLLPLKMSYIDFALLGLNNFPGFVEYTLSGIYLYALLVISIVIVLFFCLPDKYGKIKDKELFMFFLFLVLMSFVMMICMKLYPYYRNHVGHFYIGLFLGIYGLTVIINFFSRYTIIKKMSLPIISLLLIGYSFIFIHRNPSHFNFHLYYCDIDFNYKKSEAIFLQIPQSSVACSDECFYFEYLAKKAGYTVYSCGLNEADYYIINKKEKIPEDLFQNYQLHYSTEEEMVFRRRLLAVRNAQ